MKLYVFYLLKYFAWDWWITQHQDIPAIAKGVLFVSLSLTPQTCWELGIILLEAEMYMFQQPKMYYVGNMADSLVHIHTVWRSVPIFRLCEENWDITYEVPSMKGLYYRANEIPRQPTQIEYCCFLMQRYFRALLALLMKNKTPLNSSVEFVSKHIFFAPKKAFDTVDHGILFKTSAKFDDSK